MVLLIKLKFIDLWIFYTFKNYILKINFVKLSLSVNLSRIMILNFSRKLILVITLLNCTRIVLYVILAGVLYNCLLRSLFYIQMKADVNGYPLIYLQLVDYLTI